MIRASAAALFFLMAASPARADTPGPRYAMTKLNVIDLDKSLHFYTQALGLHEVRRVDLGDHDEIMLTLGGTEFEYTLVLVFQKKPKDPLTHGTKLNGIGFMIPDVRAVAKRVVDAGYELARPVQVIDPSPLPYAKNIVLAYAKDPDGVLVELVQFNK
jgi:lactoylglutathione lyase